MFFISNQLVLWQYRSLVLIVFVCIYRRVTISGIYLGICHSRREIKHISTIKNTFKSKYAPFSTRRCANFGRISFIFMKLAAICLSPARRFSSRVRRHVFLWAQKLKNMTFLATWGCASDFLKMLPKYKMAARGQPQIFLWAKTLKKKLKSEIIQILLSHSPQYGDVQVTFFKVLLKFKMAARDQLQIFCGRKNSKN